MLVGAQVRHHLLLKVKPCVITGDEDLHGEAQWQEGRGLSSMPFVASPPRRSTKATVPAVARL